MYKYIYIIIIINFNYIKKTKPGAFMVGILDIKGKIIGKGGHTSAPELCNDPSEPLLDILLAARELKSKYKETYTV